MRTMIMVAAVVALTGGLAACGADQDSSTPSTVAQPPDTTQPSAAPDTPRPTSAPDAEKPNTEEINNQEPTSVPESSAAPTQPTAPRFTPVDAAKYQIGDSYYFQSPTGNIMCGFLFEGPYGVGCQLGSVKHMSPELPNCTDAANSKAAAHLYEGKAELWCTSQGIFVGFTQGSRKGGGVVLNYGESLTINGYTCTSSSQGVRCAAGDHGFAVSAEDQHTF